MQQAYRAEGTGKREDKSTRLRGGEIGYRVEGIPWHGCSDRVHVRNLCSGTLVPKPIIHEVDHRSMDPHPHGYRPDHVQEGYAVR